MTKKTFDDMSFDEFDDVHYPRTGEPEFTAIADRMLSRRNFLGGTAAVGAGAFLTSVGLGVPRSAQAAANNWLPFKPIATSTADTITVPEGFNWHVVARWGDPLWSNAAPFDQVSRGTGASQGPLLVTTPMVWRCLLRLAGRCCASTTNFVTAR